MITTVIPKLPFIEKQRTINFYVNQLGFKLIADYGDYIIMNRVNIELHFFLFKELIPQQSNFMIYFRIDNEIEKYYKEIQVFGVKIHPNGALENKPWHQSEFSIIDPNGTLLTFGQAN
jgi:uncharacterized glyoxalase superfamily protein PhnB